MLKRLLGLFRKQNSDKQYESGSHSIVKGSVIKSDPSCSIIIGDYCLVEGILVGYTPQSEIVLGDDVFIGAGSRIGCATRIEIGHHTLISFDCIIQDTDTHHLDASRRVNDTRQWMEGKKNWENIPSKPVKIGPHAWIGARSIILKGVEIGEGAIVGAGSVVVKNVEPYTVVAGNPAHVIKKLKP